jgi:hypothetical protein
MPDSGWQRFFFAETLDALGNAPFDVALRLSLGKVLLRQDLNRSAQRVRQLVTTRLGALVGRLRRR